MDQAFVIRTATLKDLDWLYSISNLVGAGFTSLPNNRPFLEQRLKVVEQSFKEQIPVTERVYLFLRENLPSKEIVGISGIDVNVGSTESFYNFQVSQITQSCKSINKHVVHTILNLVNNFESASELISFWVHPVHRGKAISKSLSYCRFLFIAQFAKWFDNSIISEIRGVFDQTQGSPFWEALGRKFFDMDFKTADELTFADGKQFIADLVPHEPIYLDLLPADAKAVVGKAHPNSEAAIHLLEKQGFQYNQHIDIFDAGPLLFAERDKILAVANNKIATLTKTPDSVQAAPALLYNNRLDARFTAAPIEILGNDEVAISADVAAILQLKAGDQLRYYFL